MKTNPTRALSAVAAAAMIAAASCMARGKTRDVSYPFRCPAGFAGDLNRAHPASVEPGYIDVSNPPAFYGLAVLVNRTTNSIRGMAAGDTGVLRIYGINLREYPVQQLSGGAQAAPGAIAAPISGPISVCRDGYVMVKVNGAVTKDGLVYVWVAASSGAHVQGGFEAAATGGSTAAIVNAVYNGPADANGICEVIVNKTQAA